MSKFQKERLYEGRSLQNQWLNVIIATHDLHCGCTTPLDHLKELIKKETCHPTKDAATTTETGGTDGENDLILDEGDLETLFQAEKEEEER